MLYYYGYTRLSSFEENIKMELKEIGVDVMNWIDLAHDGVC